MPMGQARMTAQQKARNQIVKTILTWSHVMTLSMLALAAISHVSGLAAILFRPEIADAICKYAREWQTFFTAGILGYDAKSTIENSMKIMKEIKAAKAAAKPDAEEEETQNG